MESLFLFPISPKEENMEARLTPSPTYPHLHHTHTPDQTPKHELQTFPLDLVHVGTVWILVYLVASGKGLGLPILLTAPPRDHLGSQQSSQGQGPHHL